VIEQQAWTIFNCSVCADAHARDWHTKMMYKFKYTGWLKNWHIFIP